VYTTAFGGGGGGGVKNIPILGWFGDFKNQGFETVRANPTPPPRSQNPRNFSNSFKMLLEI